MGLFQGRRFSSMGVELFQSDSEETYLYDMSDTNLELLRVCRLFLIIRSGYLNNSSK